MSDFGREIVDAARVRVGDPFKHHFKPEDICEGGTFTTISCMERGMDVRGYDCSGLVIASVCHVIGMEPRHWPPQYRHNKQLAALAIETSGVEEGDLLLFDTAVGNRPHRLHGGIYVAPLQVIHANGLLGKVDEGEVEGSIVRVRRVPAQVLMDLTL